MDDPLKGQRLKIRARLHLQVAHFSGQAPPIVFLHGGLGNRYNWRSQFEFLLQQGHTVLAYDLAGHGQSSAYDRYSVGRHCRDLSRLLRRFQIRKPILCCHSYGVPLGLEWAQRQPVGGLVLSAGGTHDLDPWWEIPLMRSLNWGGRYLFHWNWLQGLAQRFTSQHERRSIERFFEESPIPTVQEPYNALEIFWGYNFWHRRRPRRLATPALILTGGQDPAFTQDMGDRLAEQFLRAEHLHLPNAGHLLMAEYPREVSQAILRFVQSCGSQS